MKIVLSRDAEKDFLRFSKSEQIKIDRKLLSLKQNPFVGKKLTGEFRNRYSLRAWPYRIIYKINRLEKRIEVDSILHRQGVYKK